MSAARRIALALALASPGLAAPALAQTSTVEAANRERFLALVQPLIDNIGTDGTVILLHIGFDDLDEHPGLALGVYYLGPGCLSLRMQTLELAPILPAIFSAAQDSYAADPEFRAASLVIDHGKPVLTIRRGGGGGNPPHRETMDAELKRVFPGLSLEGYP